MILSSHIQLDIITLAWTMITVGISECCQVANQHQLVNLEECSTLLASMSSRTKTQLVHNQVYVTTSSTHLLLMSGENSNLVVLKADIVLKNAAVAGA